MRPSLAQLKDKKNLVGVEIGVGTGTNAKSILENLDIACLYLVDPWEKYSEYIKELKDSKNFSAKTVLKGKLLAKKNLAKWENKLVWINEMSSIAAIKIIDSLDFVYIDGNHNYEYVKEDIEQYWPKLKPGGLMAGHDFTPRWQGVIDAVSEKFENYETADVTTDKKPNVDWWAWK